MAEHEFFEKFAAVHTFALGNTLFLLNTDRWPSPAKTGEVTMEWQGSLG